ncbi:MAG: heavy-metal-associated domain-containing protein [Bacteroidales bacterium]|nr:heavy-metal-associated domain-containing protein [Bacteroidales bacterium]
MKLFYTLLVVTTLLISGCNSTTQKSADSADTSDTTVLSNAIVDFQVKGMHCEGCENTIKTTVKELKGVSVVEASFKDNKATVTFDSLKVNSADIVAAINEAGYKVDTFMRR